MFPSVRPSHLLVTVLLTTTDTHAGGLAFSPASLNFGANALGETKTLIAKLKNTSALDIALGNATLVNNPGGYSLTGSLCGNSLPAGQSCAYTLIFKSSRLKPAQARLEVITLDPAFPMVKLPLQANPHPSINDSGVTGCGNADQDGLPCPQPGFPEQDAQYGRDNTRNIDGNGHAGFNFTKLDANGKALQATATNWDCVRDNVTGLIWERKPAGDGIRGNQGLHDADDHYTWYSTDGDGNNGFVGYPNEGDTCHGYVAGQPATYCNTEAYVQRVKVAGWCGAKDWRMPARQELHGLADLSRTRPAIDTAYFPDTRSAPYWSSAPFAYLDVGAWIVDFTEGDFESVSRSGLWNNAIRLVRGGQ